MHPAAKLNKLVLISLVETADDVRQALVAYVADPSVKNRAALVSAAETYDLLREQE